MRLHVPHLRPYRGRPAPSAGLGQLSEAWSARLRIEARSVVSQLERIEFASGFGVDPQADELDEITTRVASIWRDFAARPRIAGHDEARDAAAALADIRRATLLVQAVLARVAAAGAKTM